MRSSYSVGHDVQTGTAGDTAFFLADPGGLGSMATLDHPSSLKTMQPEINRLKGNEQSVCALWGFRYCITTAAYPGWTCEANTVQSRIEYLCLSRPARYGSAQQDLLIRSAHGDRRTGLDLLHVSCAFVCDIYPILAIARFPTDLVRHSDQGWLVLPSWCSSNITPFTHSYCPRFGLVLHGVTNHTPPRPLPFIIIPFFPCGFTCSRVKLKTVLDTLVSTLRLSFFLSSLCGDTAKVYLPALFPSQTPSLLRLDLRWRCRRANICRRISTPHTRP
jgi:hypothetical protein